MTISELEEYLEIRKEIQVHLDNIAGSFKKAWEKQQEKAGIVARSILEAYKRK